MYQLFLRVHYPFTCHALVKLNNDVRYPIIYRTKCFIENLNRYKFYIHKVLMLKCQCDDTCFRNCISNSHYFEMKCNHIRLIGFEIKQRIL